MTTEQPIRHKKKAYDATALIILAVVFIGVVALSNYLLRGVRLDLTENNLYTIAPGTKKVLSSLDEPINLYFFFSQEPSRDYPEIRAYAQRVRELLEEMAQRSNGKLHLHVLDPQPFSDEEERATQFGLAAAPIGALGQQLYFGLAGTNSTDGKQVIQFFQEDKEKFLEYDIASLIYRLAHPKRPTIGLMSELPVDAAFDPQSGQMREGYYVIQQMRSLYTVHSVTADAKEIPKDVDALVIIHPKDLQPATLYAIDQFVLRGGKLLAFMDPLAEHDQPPGQQFPGMNAGARSSTLGPLLKAWGVEFDTSKVIGDAALALSVQPQADQPPVRHLAILGIPHQNMNDKDVVTSNLQLINVWSAGILKAAPDAKTQFEPLLTSSDRAAPIEAAKFAFLSDPRTLQDGFTPSGEHYTLAARIHGKVGTAFPDGAPAGVTHTAQLKESTGDINVVLVGDTDLLADMMWVRMRTMFGQRFPQFMAHNGDFVANVLDNLTGSSDLISIRGRQSFFRPFTKVEELRQNADAQLRAKEQSLNQQLSQAEARLNELQATRKDQSSLALTPEQEQEIHRFQEERTKVRRELREVQRDLNVGIESLGNVIKWLNIVTIPLLLSIAAVLLAVRRRQRLRASRDAATHKIDTGAAA